MSFWTSKLWWSQAFERMLKTFAQALLSVIGVNAVGLVDVGWTGALSVAGLALVVSFLTSVVSTPASPDNNSPSLVSTESDQE